MGEKQGKFHAIDCSKGMMRTPGVERMPAETNNVKKVIPATIQ